MRAFLLTQHAGLLSCVAMGLLMLLATTVAAAATAAPPATERPAESRQAQAAPVDVNTATEAELVTVPGIGKALAQRIVEFREKNGPFAKIDDLIKVRGIGEKSLQRLRPYLTVGKNR